MTHKTISVYRGLLAGAFAILFATGSLAADQIDYEQVGEPLSGGPPEILFNFNGNLVVGGEFRDAGDTRVNGIATLVDDTWQPYGDGFRNTWGNAIVYALTEFEGNLIAGGLFRSSGSAAVEHIARWNDGNWEPVGDGFNGIVRVLMVYNDELIAGGNFTSSGETELNYVARWDGSLWQPVGEGVPWSGRVNDFRFACNRCLRSNWRTMNDDEIRKIEKSLETLELHPSLHAVVEEAGIVPSKLGAAIEVTDGRPNIGNRQEIYITDGETDTLGKVSSVRELFRGDRRPSRMPSGPPPAEYMPLFHFIEQHILTFCNQFGDKSDQEFEKVFNDLRRRPDGASRDELHAFIWQVAAVLAGRRELSAHEFEAIFDRLRRSARTFSIAPISRKYVNVLRNY